MDDAERYIRQWADVRKEGSTLIWKSAGGHSVMSVQAIAVDPHDRESVAEVVKLCHFMPELESLSAEQADHFNRFATQSCVVPATKSEPGYLVSKIGIAPLDEDAARALYAPLICMEAATIGYQAVCMVAGQFSRDPELSPLQNTDNDPALGEAEFERLAELLRSRGIYANVEFGGLTAEFPYDSGAVSMTLRTEDPRDLAERLDVSVERALEMCGRTMLYRVHLSTHPLYGRGIQSTLELPEELEGSEAINFIAGLNRWEMNTPALPPHLGAWCRGTRAISYVAFVPTQACVPGIIQALVGWNWSRATQVKRVLDNVE